MKIFTEIVFIASAVLTVVDTIECISSKSTDKLLDAAINLSFTVLLYLILCE